jgi:hypothetical protein
MTKTGALLAVLGLALGCHPTEALPPPPLEGARSALLVYMVGGAPAFVYAVDPAQPALPTFSRDQDSTLYLVTFACDLARVDLRAGPVPLLADPAPRRVLPEPLAVKALPLTDAPPGPWTETEAPAELQAVLTRVDVPPDSVCRRVRARYTVQDQDADLATSDLAVPRFAAPLPGGDFLVGLSHYPDLTGTSTTGSSVLRLNTDGAQPWPALEALGHLLSGLARTDGQLWLMSPTELFLGDPETGFQVVTSTAYSPSPEVVRLAGAPDGSELFAALQVVLPGGLAPSYPARRVLLQLDGEQWRRVASHDVQRAEADRISLAWLAPGELLVTGFTRSGDVLRVKDGDLSEETFGGGTARLVQVLPGRGAVVSDTTGGIFLDTPAGWTPLRQSGAPGLVEHVLALEPSGLAAFGWYGGFGVGQELPDVGACEPAVLTPLFPGVVIPVTPTRLLVLLRSIAGGQLRFAFVDQARPPSPECPE